MNRSDQVAIIVEFAFLPNTPEKDRISQHYLDDVIDHAEFFELASNYLAKHKYQQAGAEP